MSAGALVFGILGVLGVVGAAGVPSAGGPWPRDPDPGAGEEQSGDRTARLGATDRLARNATAEAPRLRALLSDVDPAIRATAARALCRVQDEAGLARASQWVLSGQPSDRTAGLDALRSARRLPPAARAAVERALVDADPSVKLMALEVLADKDPRPSLPAIAGALEDSAVPVRLQAIRLLADTRDPRAALALLARAGDVDRLVRREGIVALGSLGDERVTPPLLRLLEAPSDDLRRAAIEALAGLHSGAAVPALVAHARRRPADSVARHAQWALGEIASPEAVAALVALLAEPPVPDELRQAILRAGARAVPWLLRELDSDAGTATLAVGLLGQIGDRRAVGPLLALLRRRNQTQPAVLRALAALAPREASAPLVALAADPSRETRRLALDALVAIGDERSAGVLARALADPDPAVRSRAAALAGRLAARDHTAAVAARLGDPDPGVRAQAVQALGAMGGPASCAALAGHTGPADPLLAEALVASADPACAGHLVASLARPAPGRAARIAGLAAAVTAGAPVTPEVARWLVGGLRERGAVAERAADALAGAALASRQAPEVTELLGGLPGPVRARLCPVLATSAAGRSRLATFLADQREDDQVRAAAAWALAGAGEPAIRRVLEQARNHLHPAIAANARAALAGGRTGSPTVVQVGDGLGRPAAGRWLWFSRPGGEAVWAHTGSAGQVRLSGLGAGATAQVTGGTLLLDHPRDRLGQIAGDQVPAAQGARRLPGGQAVQVHAGAGGVESAQPLRAQAGDQAREHVPAARRPQ